MGLESVGHARMVGGEAPHAVACGDTFSHKGRRGSATAERLSKVQIQPAKVTLEAKEDLKKRATCGPPSHFV